jgi:hypothetical protein
MKKAISFSLWGDKFRYNGGAVQNAQLALEVYPDWDCVFFIGSSVPEKTIEDLSKFPNVKLLSTTAAGDWTGMFWRFILIDSGEYDAVIVRDVDSRLSFREKAAVDEWLKSDKLFHIMRDNHQHNTEILGGMWGVRKNVLNFSDAISRYSRVGDYWQTDQNFLRDVVWSIASASNVTHDEFFAKINFPFGVRDPFHFVGQAYDGDGTVLGSGENFFDYFKDEKKEYEKYASGSR